MDQTVDRAVLASQALSELSQLNGSSYTPVALRPGSPVLARRVPHEGATAVPSDSDDLELGSLVTSTSFDESAGVQGDARDRSRRTRDPEAVRARLADFRAGVVRGRGQRPATGEAGDDTTATATAMTSNGGDPAESWAEPVTEER